MLARNYVHWNIFDKTASQENLQQTSADSKVQRHCKINVHLHKREWRAAAESVIFYHHLRRVRSSTCRVRIIHRSSQCRGSAKLDLLSFATRLCELLLLLFYRFKPQLDTNCTLTHCWILRTLHFTFASDVARCKSAQRRVTQDRCMMKSFWTEISPCYSSRNHTDWSFRLIVPIKFR